APYARGLRGHLWNALQNGALEVELQQHTERPRQSWVHRDRKIQREQVACFEELLDGRERLRVARLQHSGIGASRRTERGLDGRAMVEQRQEHDDALGNGRPQARIQAGPTLSIPALDRVELMQTVLPTLAQWLFNTKWHVPRRQEVFQL